MNIVKTNPRVVKPKVPPKKEEHLTGDALISFISNAQTNIGRSTFYNLAGEQRQAMIDMHNPILKESRPFYALMMLPQGVNDVNKQMIAWNLIENSMPATDEYKSVLGPTHKYSAQNTWENELILQIFENMSVPRVFDFLVSLQDKKVTKRRAMFLIKEFIVRNKQKWALWALKYRNEFKRVLRHAHLKHKSLTEQDYVTLTAIWRYLKYNDQANCPQLIKDYIAVQEGDKDKLAKLPATVAEGFMTKFHLSKDDFWKLFDQGGGRFTAKEKRLKATSVSEAGVDTGFDIRKANLFDALVYLRSLDRLPESPEALRKILDEKAKAIADKLTFTLDNVGLILDTSKSLVGTKEQHFHPALRSLAISMVIRHVSNGYKEYRMSKDTESLFPKIKNQSNYAEALVAALKDGCTTIVVVGDGYENAPFEGMFHSILYAYKNRIDKENKCMILHFNPVFAAEAMDVRSISSLASSIGVREVTALNEAMFLAVAKHKPELAISKFTNYLLKLQNSRAKQLMPTNVLKTLAVKQQSLLGE